MEGTVVGWTCPSLLGSGRRQRFMPGGGVPDHLPLAVGTVASQFPCHPAMVCVTSGQSSPLTFPSLAVPVPHCMAASAPVTPAQSEGSSHPALSQVTAATSPAACTRPLPPNPQQKPCQAGLRNIPNPALLSYRSPTACIAALAPGWPPLLGPTS